MFVTYVRKKKTICNTQRVFHAVSWRRMGAEPPKIFCSSPKNLIKQNYITPCYRDGYKHIYIQVKLILFLQTTKTSSVIIYSRRRWGRGGGCNPPPKKLLFRRPCAIQTIDKNSEDAPVRLACAWKISPRYRCRYRGCYRALWSVQLLNASYRTGKANSEPLICVFYIGR